MLPHNRRIVFKSLAGVLVWLLVIADSFAADPASILSTFQLHPDFQIELVASEPIVFSPVDLEFDAQSRALLLEMPGYPFPNENNPGKVILLGDADQDGVYEQRTVFATGFPVATSILPYQGGLLVASPPDLLFVKDTDGDNVADVRETWISGFELDNTQHNFNGLAYGLDNWVYGVSGGNNGEPFLTNAPDTKMPLRWSDFRFDYAAKKLERIGRSSGGYGLAIDDYGRLFGTHNTEHISHIVFPGHFIDGLPVGRSGSLNNISNHSEGGLARIYPIGTQETRVNHPEQSGYFSGSCGITYYGGGAFPEEFNNSTFIGDVVVNIVHHDKLVPEGASFLAERTRDKVEFLATTDRAFRPVSFSVGPDGALYVMDMHRDVIEHPEWIPDEMEAKLDINAGKDKGRVFRITPKGGLKRPAVAFTKSDIKGAIEALGDKNQWWRTTAQRMLVEWKDMGAVKPLKKVAKSSKSSQARLHAMWTLEGLRALDTPLLIGLLHDEDAGVRENALVISERFLKDKGVVDAVLVGAADYNPRVRLFTALTLSRLDDATLASHTVKVDEALFAIARQDASEPWVRLGLLSALSKRPAPMIVAMLGDSALMSNPDSAALLQPLAEMTGHNNDTGEAKRVVDALLADKAIPREVLVSVFDGLSTGFEANGQKTDPAAFGETLASLDGLLSSEHADIQRSAFRLSRAMAAPESDARKALLSQAAVDVLNGGLDTPTRVQRLQVLQYTDFASRKDALYALIAPQQPKELQLAAMVQLRNDGDVEVAKHLIEIWSTLGPDARYEASNILLHKPSNHDVLLTALESGSLPIGQFNFDLERRRRLLFWAKDESIKKRAEALFTDAGVVTRKAAMDKMTPALALAGVSDNGKLAYQELCMKCHQMGAEGAEVGPNLTEIYRKSPETLMHDILDPNAACDTKYIGYTIETKGADATFGGEVYTGVVRAEDDTSVTIREANGVDRTFQKSEIATMTSNGMSFMPEGLEEGMTPQKMADLLAYLQVQK